MKKDYCYSNLKEISDLIRQGKLSPAEVMDGCLTRIQEINSKLNAFITVLVDDARQQAQVAETEIRAGKWRGPLHGIPVGIKDFYDTAGVRTTAAFEPFKSRVPKKDAVSVSKLREAGAIIVGKTNMHTLGTGTTGLESYFGPVKNPWNAQYVPGGSSSGSAAAVASGMCYATIDTDAIGSCRLPAACCGVVGFKGTYGLVNLKGILEGETPPDEMIQWFSHAGITTRDVGDTALILNVLAERASPSGTSDFAGGLARNMELRIGVADNFQADQAITESFEKALEIIRRLGYTMKRVSAPLRYPSGGLGTIEADRKAITGQAFKDIDVLLLPTTTTAVPTTREADNNPLGLSPENTGFANYYGLPAISVPCGFDAKGLPLGLQIVGKPWDDVTVLRVAYQFQGVAAFAPEHPNL